MVMWQIGMSHTQRWMTIVRWVLGLDKVCPCKAVYMIFLICSIKSYVCKSYRETCKMRLVGFEETTPA